MNKQFISLILHHSTIYRLYSQLSPVSANANANTSASAYSPSPSHIEENAASEKSEAFAHTLTQPPSTSLGYDYHFAGPYTRLSEKDFQKPHNRDHWYEPPSMEDPQVYLDRLLNPNWWLGPKDLSISVRRSRKLVTDKTYPVVERRVIETLPVLLSRHLTEMVTHFGTRLGPNRQASEELWNALSKAIFEMDVMDQEDIIICLRIYAHVRPNDRNVWRELVRKLENRIPRFSNFETALLLEYLKDLKDQGRDKDLPRSFWDAIEGLLKRALPKMIPVELAAWVQLLYQLGHVKSPKLWKIVHEAVNFGNANLTYENRILCREALKKYYPLGQILLILDPKVSKKVNFEKQADPPTMPTIVDQDPHEKHSTAHYLKLLFAYPQHKTYQLMRYWKNFFLKIPPEDVHVWERIEAHTIDAIFEFIPGQIIFIVKLMLWQKPIASANRERLWAAITEAIVAFGPHRIGPGHLTFLLTKLAPLRPTDAKLHLFLAFVFQQSIFRVGATEDAWACVHALIEISTHTALPTEVWNALEQYVQYNVARFSLEHLVEWMSVCKDIPVAQPKLWQSFEAEVKLKQKNNLTGANSGGSGYLMIPPTSKRPSISKQTPVKGGNQGSRKVSSSSTALVHPQKKSLPRSSTKKDGDVASGTVVTEDFDLEAESERLVKAAAAAAEEAESEAVSTKKDKEDTSESLGSRMLAVIPFSFTNEPPRSSVSLVVRTRHAREAAKVDVILYKALKDGHFRYISIRSYVFCIKRCVPLVYTKEWTWLQPQMAKACGHIHVSNLPNIVGFLAVIPTSRWRLVWEELRNRVMETGGGGPDLDPKLVHKYVRGFGRARHGDEEFWQFMTENILLPSLPRMDSPTLMDTFRRLVFRRCVVPLKLWQALDAQMSVMVPVMSEFDRKKYERECYRVPGGVTMPKFLAALQNTPPRTVHHKKERPYILPVSPPVFGSKEKEKEKEKEKK